MEGEVSDGNRSEIGLSTEMELSWGSGNFVENVPHVHQGFDQVDGSTQWLPDERSATSACTSASAVSVLRNVSYAHPSLAALPRAKFKRCLVTPRSLASNDTSGTVYNQ